METPGAQEQAQGKAQETRTFPIMGRRVTERGVSIPWALIAPHEAQALVNHGGQTLERLAERGGLAPCEALAVLEDRTWRAIPPGYAEDDLAQFVAKAFATLSADLTATRQAREEAERERDAMQRRAEAAEDDWQVAEKRAEAAEALRAALLQQIAKLRDEMYAWQGLSDVRMRQIRDWRERLAAALSEGKE